MKKICVLAFCSLVAINFTGCDYLRSDYEKQAPPLISNKQPKLNTAKVKKGDLVASHTHYGVLKSQDHEIIYASKFGGIMDEKNFETWDTVQKGDIIAKLNTDELDEAITLQKIEVENAKIKYEKLKSQSVDKFDIDIALNNIKYEEEKLNNLNKKRERSIFYSPVDGVLTEITGKEIFDEISSLEFIAVVEKMDNVGISIDDLGEEIYIYSEGMKAIITYDNEEYMGEVATIDVDYDNEGNPSHKAFIKFTENAPKDLVANKRIEYTVIGEEKENVLIIPKQALFYDGDKAIVFVLEENVRVKKEIEVGMVSSDYIEVTSGLNENEIVILK